MVMYDYSYMEIDYLESDFEKSTYKCFALCLIDIPS